MRNSLSSTFKLHKTINLDGAVLQKMKYPETDVLGPLDCLFAITHREDGDKGEQKVDLFRVDVDKEYVIMQAIMFKGWILEGRGTLFSGTNSLWSVCLSVSS